MANRQGARSHWVVLWLVSLILGSAVAACAGPDLTTGTTPIARPGANPSGRILFVQHGHLAVWQDGKIQQLGDVSDAAWARWSPDGQRIAYVRMGDSYSDLWVANADGSAAKALTRNQPSGQPGTYNYVQQAVWALMPAWLPDGSTIAYISDLNTAKNFLWLISSTGGQPRLVGATTRLGDNIEWPSVSPDGQRVVFALRVTGETELQRRTDLWVVNLTTGEVAPLVQGGDGNYAPAWSPDGQWIAFVSRHGEQNDLAVVSARGGQPVQLTTLGTVAAPAWSPDGQQLAFLVAEKDGSFSVEAVRFSVDANGTPQASTPSKLFSAPDIDARSGLSWSR